MIFTVGSSSSMSVAGPLSYRIIYLKWGGATCVADLDSGALALTKEASGNSGAACVPLVLTRFSSQGV